MKPPLNQVSQLATNAIFFEAKSLTMMRLTIHLGHLLWQTLQLLGGADFPWWKEEIFPWGEIFPNNLGEQLVLIFCFHEIFWENNLFGFFFL